MRETLGTYLRKLRINRGLKQAEFAGLLGVVPTYISNLENEIRFSLGEKNIARFSTVLGLTQEEEDQLREYKRRAQAKISIPPYASTQEAETLHLLVDSIGRIPPEYFVTIENLIRSWRTIAPDQAEIIQKGAKGM